MNVLNLEHFLFSSDILYVTETEENEILIPMKILFTMASIYIYAHDPKKLFNKDTNQGLILQQSSDRSAIVSNNSSTSQINKVNNTNKIKTFEDCLIVKLDHCDIILADYDINNVIIEYVLLVPRKQNPKKDNQNSKKENIKYPIYYNQSHRFKFKNSSLKEKNYIKTMIIIEGYKYAINHSILSIPLREDSVKRKKTIDKNEKKIFNKNSYINCEYLFNLINNLIENNFKLIIKPNFFDEDPKLLKEFTPFLSFLKELKIECILYEEEENSKQDNPSSNEETFASAISDRFNLEKIEKSVEKKTLRNMKTIKDNKPINKSIMLGNIWYLISIDVSNTYLNDRGFSKSIIQLIEKCPYLKYLNLSYNLLSNQVFVKLLESKNYQLKELNLSYNKIKSDNLNLELRWIVMSYLNLDNLNLQGNVIRNVFLKKFNPEKFDDLLSEIRKIVNENSISSQNSSKKSDSHDNFNKIIINLKDNYFNIEEINNSFYLWKTDIYKFWRNIKEFSCNDDEEYNKDVTKKVNIEIDKNFGNFNNFQLLFDYPYLKFSNNYFKEKDEKAKQNKFTAKINTYKIKKTEEENVNIIINQLDIYRELFKYFFLIDYYFDPILNSFNHSWSVIMKKQKEYLNEKNQYVIFDNLKKLAKLDNNDLKEQIKKKEIEYNELRKYSSYFRNNCVQSKYENFEIPKFYAQEMVYQFNYFTKKDTITSLTKNVFGDLIKKNTQINPNAFIDDLYIFLLFFKKVKYIIDIEIPFSTLNKLINRIKMEIFLSLNDKDYYILGILNNICPICKFKDLNYKVKKEYELLKIQTGLIDEGLIKIINFTGKEQLNINKSKTYLAEVNNYLDIFIKEASLINYNSEIICLSRYIQYLRNNKIRSKFYIAYEDILHKNNIQSYVSKLKNSFDEVFLKYSHFSETLVRSLPIKIQYKELCYHPLLIDYLKLCEANKEILESDLKIISEHFTKENFIDNYATRNVYNRITFLFLKNSIKIYPNKYGYNLSKGNSYLKMSRVLFRYFNNLDKNKYNEIINNREYVYNSLKIPIDESKTNIIFQVANFNIRHIQNYTEDSILHINNYKLKLLNYSEKGLGYSIIDINKEMIQGLTKERKNNFKEISKDFYAHLTNCVMPSSVITNFDYIFRNIKELIRMYLRYKNQYSNDKVFWKILNKEFFYLIIKFMNRDNFEFSVLKTDQARYSFGILYILSFYLELKEGLIIFLKEFLCYLYIRRYFPHYCKRMLDGLNNPYRYEWVMSSYEMKQRLFNENIKIKIFFYEGYYETYEINEHTTILDLFQKIINTSPIMSKINERDLYWIYLIENTKGYNYNIHEDKEYQSVYANIITYLKRTKNPLKKELYNIHTEDDNGMKILNLKPTDFILEVIGKIEEKLLLKFGHELKKKNTDTETENNENNAEIKIVKDLEEEFNNHYTPEKGLDDELFKYDMLFEFFHFGIRRRIYSPILKAGNINELTIPEQKIIFEQISKIFSLDKRNIRIPFDIGKKIGILLLVNKKKFNINKNENEREKKFDLKSNVNDLFPSNISKHGGFKALPIEDLFEDRMKNIDSISYLIKEFFLLVKNTEILFSNVYFNCKVIKNNYPKIILIPEIEKINIIIYLESIEFVEPITYKTIFTCSYSDIIKCTLKEENIIKLYIFYADMNKNEEIELRIKFETNKAPFIMEDILSHLQYYLCRNTMSNLCRCYSQKEIIQTNLENYKLIYQRKSNKALDVNRIKIINEKEEERFKELKKSNQSFLEYKARKLQLQKEKEEEELRKKKEREELEKKLREEEERKKGEFNIRKIFKYSPITGELQKEGEPLKNIAQIKSETSSESSEVKIEKLNLKRISKNYSSPKRKTLKTIDKSSIMKEVISINNNIPFYSSDNESKSDISSKKKKSDVVTYNDYNKFKEYDSFWDLYGMDEKELLTQIEKERQVWNEKVESKSSSFNIPFNNQNKNLYAHEKKRDKLNMKIDKANKDINNIINEYKEENISDISKKSSNNSNLSTKQKYPF